MRVKGSGVCILVATVRSGTEKANLRFRNFWVRFGLASFNMGVSKK